MPKVVYIYIFNLSKVESLRSDLLRYSQIVEQACRYLYNNDFFATGA